MYPAKLWLARFANLTVAATFCLLFLGGMVTSLDAGLSVPDWPGTFGHNMWAFPFERWKGLVFWEHTHRVVASGVGFMVILLLIGIWMVDGRRWVKQLGIAAVVLVSIQGIMGGLRVTKVSITLAIIHGITAQVFFCLLILIAMAVSAAWNRPLKDPTSAPKIGKLRGWAWSLIGVLLIQLILGAVMRHNGAGLSMPYFPVDPDGHFMPRVHNMMVDIHFTHRVWAIVVTVMALIVGVKALRASKSDIRILLPAIFIISLVAVQIFLGAQVIWLARASIPTSLHVVNGALILSFSFVLAVRSSYYASICDRSPQRQSELTAV